MFVDSQTTLFENWELMRLLPGWQVAHCHLVIGTILWPATSHLPVSHLLLRDFFDPLSSCLLSSEMRGKNIFLLSRLPLIVGIPHICHERHRRRLCKFILAGVNIYRFNAKNWQFTVLFVIIYAFFGVNFILQKLLPV